MVSICVLVRVLPGKVKSVLADIRKIKEVEEVFSTFGRYDIVVFASVPDHAKAREIVRAILSIEGVRSTETLVEI